MKLKIGLFLFSLIHLSPFGRPFFSPPLLAGVMSEIPDDSFFPETEEEKKTRCAEVNAKVYGDCCSQSGIDCNNPRDDKTCTLKGNNAEKDCLAKPSPAPKDIAPITE